VGLVRDYQDLSRRESLRVPVVGTVKLPGAWHLDSSMAWIKRVLAAGRRWTPATTEGSGNVEAVQQIEVVTVTKLGVLGRAGQVRVSDPLSGAFT